jgi:hypothetical protein
MYKAMNMQKYLTSANKIFSCCGSGISLCGKNLASKSCMYLFNTRFEETEVHSDEVYR